MRYSIGQVAKKLGLTTHTIRYYDKEGLLPFVRKGSSGARVFGEDDVDWLIIVECLKGTGMPLKEIRTYIQLCQQGDTTLQKRLEMFKKQKEEIEKQMRTLKQYMEKIDFKIAYYGDAVEHGTDDIYIRNKWLAKERERLFGHK